VNADDFGMTTGVNHGVACAHEHGIATSASLMVRGAAAREAAAYARERPTLSVGLHVDLGEWEFRSGEWRQLYDVAPTDDPRAVEAELELQLERFRALVGREPTHLDSHQHVHREEPARSAFVRVSTALGIPLRGESSVRYCGSFYGQTGTGEPIADAISAASLVNLIRSIPDGATEIGCHPAAVSDMTSVYRNERVHELEALCDPRVRAAIVEERIVLSSFARLHP
jgi:predicted glycoside hydrolase/deacetylase ChbG (UPF0249 family)